jgi:hypothetical protein
VVGSAYATKQMAKLARPRRFRHDYVINDRSVVATRADPVVPLNVGTRQLPVLAPGDASELPTSAGWTRWDTLGYSKSARGRILGPITLPAAMSCSPVMH